MARKVVETITEDIKRGCVVMTYKTKPRTPSGGGGRQLVSVGPYRTAVPGPRYAVIGRGWDHTYPSARSAAQAFVNFVGRDVAWNAKRRCRSR